MPKKHGDSTNETLADNLTNYIFKSILVIKFIVSRVSSYHLDQVQSRPNPYPDLNF